MSKNIVRIGLLLFLVSAVGFWGIKTWVGKNREKTKISKINTVYYFHGNVRCRTCNLLENYTKQAINEYFAKDIKSGNLKVISINIDKSENEHFVKNFNLLSKTVVLSENIDGKLRYKKLDKIWKVVRDKNRFFNYIKTETSEFFKISKVENKK
jgi:hypothetical protein